MNLNEYQEAALTTAVYPEDKRIIYPALGMCGEAGEVADKVKKVIRDNNQSFDTARKIEIAKKSAMYFGIVLRWRMTSDSHLNLSHK